MARLVKCVKLGREAEGLDFPPYPGALGKRLYENVSKEAWQQWLRHQTMLVNENRLNLADARARKYLAEQMEKHFFGEGADVAQGYVPPLDHVDHVLGHVLGMVADALDRLGDEQDLEGPRDGARILHHEGDQL